MQSHQLSKLNKKRRKRVGRGGKRGTYSGKGIKGQRARSGHRIRPQIRDVIKKIHKRRGYFFKSIQEKPAVVNLGDLNKKFSDGDKITPQTLLEAGLIKAVGGEAPAVKILGTGKLTKKLVFDKDLLMSKSAKENVGKI